MQANPNIGREEREELWGVLPDIHLAALSLCNSLTTRLGRHITPLAPELLDQAVRVFKASHSLSEIRESSYNLFGALLEQIGPSLARITVDSLDHIIQACCQDLLGASGQLGAPGAVINGATPPNQDGKPSKQAKAMNADLYLPSNNGLTAWSLTSQLSPSHRSAAEQFLVACLTYIPQKHLKKAARALMDRTAVLTSCKPAMVAGVLHPYVDRAGRRFANTLPFLAQAFPHDADVEILRSNLRTQPYHFRNALGVDDAEEVDGIDNPQGDDENRRLGISDGSRWASRALEVEPSTSFGAVSTSAIPTTVFGSYSKEREKPPVGKPDLPPLSFGTATSDPLVLKRKSEEEVPTSPPPKRVDKGKTPEVPVIPEVTMTEGDDGSDSDESVHLQAVLEDEDEEDDGDDE